MIERSVKWGLPTQADPPTEKEIKAVMRTINKKANKERVFSLRVTGAMYNWLKNNLENAHVKLAMSGNDISADTFEDHWILVGMDRYVVEKHYKAI